MNETVQGLEGGRFALSPDGTSLLIVPDDPSENCRVMDPTSGVALAERTNASGASEGLLYRSCGSNRFLYVDMDNVVLTLSELGTEARRNDLRTFIAAGDDSEYSITDAKCSPDNKWLGVTRYRRGRVYLYDISDIPTAVREFRLHGLE